MNKGRAESLADSGVVVMWFFVLLSLTVIDCFFLADCCCKEEGGEKNAGIGEGSFSGIPSETFKKPNEKSEKGGGELPSQMGGRMTNRPAG